MASVSLSSMYSTTPLPISVLLSSVQPSSSISCVHCLAFVVHGNISPHCFQLMANKKKSRKKYVSCYPLSFTAYRKILFTLYLQLLHYFFVFLSFPPLSLFDLSISSALPLFCLSPLLLFGFFSQKTKQQTKMENNW